MSIFHLNWVWENGPQAPSERLMLLALADHANDSGLCWPGLNLLATKCCVTVRTARKTLRKLEEAGWITTTIGGGRYSSRYIIVTDPGHPRPLTPVTHDRSGGAPTTSEPSVEPLIDPPVENPHPVDVTVCPDSEFGQVIMCNIHHWFIDSCACNRTGVSVSDEAYLGRIDGGEGV